MVAGIVTLLALLVAGTRQWRKRKTSVDTMEKTKCLRLMCWNEWAWMQTFHFNKYRVVVISSAALLLTTTNHVGERLFF